MSCKTVGYKFKCDICDKEEIMTINSLPEYWDKFSFCFESDNQVYTHWDICNVCNPHSRGNRAFFNMIFDKLKRGLK